MHENSKHIRKYSEKHGNWKFTSSTVRIPLVLNLKYVKIMTLISQNVYHRVSSGFLFTMEEAYDHLLFYFTSNFFYYQVENVLVSTPDPIVY